MKDIQLVSLKIKRELWHKVKVRAVSENKTITQWLAELLEKEVGGKNG